MAFGSYTRAQIRTKLLAKVDASPFFTATEANFCINEAINAYGLMTGLWQTRLVLATVANQVYYELPTDILLPYRMRFGNTVLHQATIPDIDNTSPGWEAETTASGGDVPTSPQAWIPLGWTTYGTGLPQAWFAIWPAHAAGSGSLIIDGIAPPPLLFDDADIIDLDDADLEAILARALMALIFKHPGSIAKLSEPLMLEFARAVIGRNARLGASDQFRKILGLDQRALRPMLAKKEQS